jgi:hypothetical protein
VHRPGYYAPKPYSERSALERRLDAAEKIVSGRASGSLDAAMLAAAFPGDAKGSWVPVLVEVRGADLLDLSKLPDVLPVEIYVYAVDAEGRVRDFYSKSVELDLSKVGDTLRRSGLKLFGSLDLAPGDYTLRLLVRDGLTGRTAVRTASLNVPGEGSSDTLLLTPLFPEDPNRWLMVQDVDEARSRGIAYPFLIEETPFVPSVRPVVAKGSTVPVALMAYNLGSGELEVGSRLLDAEGNELFAPRLEILSRAREGSPTRMKAELETPAVDSGTYVLEVTVRQGDRQSRSSIPLVIEQG